MKKVIQTVAIAAIISFSFPMVANANPDNCVKASKNSAWYQSKAAALWTAYGGCRGVEWMGGKVKSHCESVHKHAKSYQKKANHWHHYWVNNCVKD